MVPNTEETHFTVLLDFTEDWLKQALDRVKLGEIVTAGVVIQATNAKYKVCSDIPDLGYFCGCGDLSKGTKSWN